MSLYIDQLAKELSRRPLEIKRLIGLNLVADGGGSECRQRLVPDQAAVPEGLEASDLALWPRPVVWSGRMRTGPSAELPIRVRVNGREYREAVAPRLLLSDFLRHRLGLTGTHVGCEHGVCGACTVFFDGEPVRSCLMLAVQADGAELTTVEGLAPDGERLHPVQEAFRQEHALQCGFCTPGLLVTVVAFLRETPRPSDHEIREALAGHLCRCTGYQNIVRAVRRASELLAAEARRS